MADFHNLTIHEITRQTPSAVTISFAIPAELKEKFTFTPGQYITLQPKVNGEAIRRAYSICSTPTEDLLTVAVKEVKDGTFSVIANNTLKAGDVLEVHPPEGTFLLPTNPSSTKTYCAFAAGSGITPIMSMIKTTMEQEKHSRFVLVYGNQSLSETIFAKELLSLQAQYPDRLFTEFFYSRSREEGARFGRIEKSTVNYIVKNKFKEEQFENFYLCGPEEMINTVKETLLENGISNDNIHFELFTSSTETTEMDASLEGKTEITVIVDDEEYSFVMDQKKTILDASLDKDIDAPYSCQGGICSSCICRVTEGTAVMEKNSILTDGEIAEGLTLACQAHPTSATIKIDFDDV
ncbi:ferredoxin--NADP reductase [Aquimarina brevivitae]|uniref:Ring-1,2-phenylacetyl-CoA epoxidase subunit PaaE n=1 Tax=Aquimarina brevivitae TaxID=323412 RepID=A0A4Q7PFY5_9FLAO|nr:ferredoxin--NADP reductase [Aquimarina brevivitae]RZS99265.1 ring-1,2-phenylacetyl-CoA epoxidase subunit PaaE [Aquimarina brevivitae]